MAAWYGHAKLAGKWTRLTGPHEGLGAAAAALDAEVRRLGLLVRSRDQALTRGPAAPAGENAEGRRRGQQ
jgi:hypothetical protein